MSASGQAALRSVLLNFFTFRIIANRPHRRDISVPLEGPAGSAFMTLEFDDQGLMFDERGIGTLETHLAALNGRDPVIVVFVHGWKHDASPGDIFLDRVRALVAEAAKPSGRPILAIYLAWRGLSRAGNWLWENSSFWDRQAAAGRVAAGTPREILGRLRTFRNGPGDGGQAQATLLIVGHSFGGLIVYAAIAQSLIDAAASTGPVVPSYGDLVLLLNPAFSAISYLPMQSIIGRREFSHDQLPVFVSVTAANDRATGILYPLGNVLRPLTEAWRTAHEREALTRTMGHLAWLRTHTLAAATQSASTGNPTTSLQTLGQPGAAETIGGVLVTATNQKSRSPFWVASATPDVIDGHDGIFLPRFENFVRALLQAHAETPKPVSGTPRRTINRGGDIDT